jgi:hypothetical protein
MLVWKLVHILGMFGAFALVFVPLFLQLVVARSGDVRAARATYLAGKVLGRAAFASFVVGLIGAVVAAISVGWSFTAPWLLASYTLLALIGALEAALLGPWRQRLERAFAAPNDDGALTAELQTLLCSPRPRLYAWSGTVALAAIVALMVLKPSFGL